MVMTYRYRDEHGLTLVEMMVTLVILGIVMTALTSGAITLYRASHQADLTSRNQNEARTAISVLSRDVRTAAPVRTDPAFLVARPNEAFFTAMLDDAPRQQLVRLFVDATGRLVEDATAPDPGTTVEGGLTWDVDNNSRVRFIASFVANDDASPLFRYLDVNSNELEMSEAPCPGPDGVVAPPCLEEAQRNNIAIVGISLSVSSDPSERARHFTVEQLVRLPNA